MQNQNEYESAWRTYACEDEMPRFLSDSEEDLLRICDCVDPQQRYGKRPRTSGGIPLHFDAERSRLYVLKQGPHTSVEGITGCGKSRTVVRGAIVSAALNHDSLIAADPKGELCGDPKIQYILKKEGFSVHVLDFRTFDKDGFNLFTGIIGMKKAGRDLAAADAIQRFTVPLHAGKVTKDDYWNDLAEQLIASAMTFVLEALAELDRLEDFHIGTVSRFMDQDQDTIRAIFSCILENVRERDVSVWSSLQKYADIYKNPERTCACIISSAAAMLSVFTNSEAMERMLSVSTFQLQDFYRSPSALFLVVPDETNAYDAIVGQLLNTFYELLVSEYAASWQENGPAPCSIKFLCDEVASVKISDMSAKISASRSRQIDWTLIYQSEPQMEKAYPEDFPSIRGNCRTRIFMGSSDCKVLQRISTEAGSTQTTVSGQSEPLVSIDALRRMRHAQAFKEALVMRDQWLYCARLPDYDVYPFLQAGPRMRWPDRLSRSRVRYYSPKDLYRDFKRERLTFTA